MSECDFVIGWCCYSYRWAANQRPCWCRLRSSHDSRRGSYQPCLCTCLISPGFLSMFLLLLQNWKFKE